MYVFVFFIFVYFEVFLYLSILCLVIFIYCPWCPWCAWWRTRYDARWLAANVVKTNTQIIVLNLNKNGIKSAGAKAIAEAIEGNDGCRIRTIMMDGNGIGNDGSKAVANAVQSNNTELTSITMVRHRCLPTFSILFYCHISVLQEVVSLHMYVLR